MNIRTASFQDVNGFGSSPDGLGMTVREASPNWLGEDAPPAPVVVQDVSPMRRTLAAAYAIAGVAGTALGAYHGYKRNNSVGWAIGWALLGGIAPVIVIPVAFAQGIGKRKGSR